MEHIYHKDCVKFGGGWVFEIKILASRLQHFALYSGGFYIYSVSQDNLVLNFDRPNKVI